MPEVWEQVRETWQPVIRRRREYLADISDADLSHDFAYRRFTGEAYSLPLVQQMQHVVNHATLHRGAHHCLMTISLGGGTASALVSPVRTRHIPAVPLDEYRI